MNASNTPSLRLLSDRLRPLDFNDVVGQEPATQRLAQQLPLLLYPIKPPGTGKTTLARIGQQSGQHFQAISAVFDWVELTLGVFLPLPRISMHKGKNTTFCG